VSVPAHGTTWTAFLLNNTGNVETTVNLTLSLPNFPSNLTISFDSVHVGLRTYATTAGYANFTFNATEVANVTLFVNATSYSGPPSSLTFSVKSSVRSLVLARPLGLELPVTLRVS